jgi:hypothetical protein
MVNGYDTRCKECFKKYQKSLKQAHKNAPPKPDSCHLCDATGRLYLDHCHKTHKARQWLCGDCNKGMGYLKEDPVLLQKVINYLSIHNASQI